VRMCRCSDRWRNPLLEYAKLGCTVARRGMHSGFHSRPPFLPRSSSWDYLQTAAAPRCEAAQCASKTYLLLRL
jgi:hypothetical protein